MSRLTLITTVLAVTSFVTPIAFAEETGEKRPSASEAEVAEMVAEMEEEDEPLFTAGFDNDLFTAYVWRNAVFSDELVWEPCVWAEFNVNEWFSLGGFVWQNWDLTANPSKSGRPRAMNETDFNVYVSRSLWTSDDEAYDINLEIGNDFFTYRQQEDVPNSYEFYLKLRLDNPFVGFYGQYSQAYEPVAAPYFELGLDKEVTFSEIFSSESDFLERWTVGATWNLSFASGKYFTNYLYGTLPGEYDPESEEYDERGMSNGIGGTTLKGTIAYQVCEHFSLGLVVAYTALLTDEACDAMDWAEYGNMYKRLVWGGLQAKLDF